MAGVRRRGAANRDRGRLPPPPPPGRPTTPWWRTTLARAALVVAASFAVGWPAIDGDWLWDDDTSITANPTTRGPYSFLDVWIAPKGPDYFPLTATGFWLEWHAFGEKVVGYHVVNIVLHALSSLLLWRLLSAMRLPGGWVAGLLFAVHPLAVESVAWISELKNTLAQPLFLLAAIHAVRADDADRPRVTGDDLLALAWYLLAMFAKTSVVMFPVVMLLHAWWRRGTIRPADVLRAAPMFLVSLVLGLVTIHFQHSKAIGEERIPVGGPASRAALAGMSIAFYLWKVILPVGLLPIYPRWGVDPPRAWQFLPWAVLAGAAAIAWTRRATWGRHAILVLGFFVLMLLPILGFVTISYMRITWVADHFVYLPMISLLGAVAAIAVRWHAELPRPARGWATGAGAAVTLALAVASARYSAAWHDEKALWTHTLAGNPDAWQAHNRLGAVLVREGDIDGAHEHFVASSRLRPDLGETHNNHGQTLMLKGRVDEAIAAFETAIAATPGILVIHMNLANALASTGRLADAEKVLRDALVRAPDALPLRLRRADLLGLLDRLDEAAAQYRIVLDAMPRNPVAWNNRGVCLLKLGRRAEAIECFRRALAISPGLPDAVKNLQTAEQQAAPAPPR